MTFDRKAAMPKGHRLYTSAAAIRALGCYGPHIRNVADYDSRGWLVPPKPADVAWADYAPKRIRPLRSPARTGPSEWTAPRVSLRRPGVVVHMANDGPTDAWLAERNAAGTATSHGQNATRIERLLVAEKSELVVPLRLVKELMRPPVTVSNDNTPPGDEADTGMGAERIHDQGSFLPSIPELLTALGAAWRPHVVTNKCRRGPRVIQRRNPGRGPAFVEGNVLLGSTNWRGKLTGLIFRDGELVAYGDSQGKKRQPKYIADARGLVYGKDSETEKHVAAQPDQDVGYTRLRSAATYVSARSPDAPRGLAPPQRTARAIANDNVLAKAVANTKVMPPITRLPDGVAADYGRLAGVSELRGTGEGRTSAGRHEALMELERAGERAAAGIDPIDLEVLDAVFDDASFRSIGLRFRHAKSSAHHMGRKIVERALKKISKNIAA